MLLPRLKLGMMASMNAPRLSQTMSPPSTFNWDVTEPFTIRYVVSEEDIDILGHANNARYLAWLEKVAWEHSLSLGLDWARYQELDLVPVARRTEMNYLAEALEGDPLLLATWISENKGRATLWRSYQIIRETDGMTLMRARTQWAIVRLSDKRPIKQPAVFLDASKTHPDCLT